MKLENNPLLVPFSLLIVGVQKERERRTLNPDRRLHHKRHQFFPRLLVLVFETVRFQVVIGPIGDPLQLSPAPGELILDIKSGHGVVRPFLVLVLAELEIFLLHSQLAVPLYPLLLPVLEPLIGLLWLAEPLQLGLLKLPRTEDEIPGGDFIAKGLADLGNSKRKFEPGGVNDVLELNEIPCAVSGRRYANPSALSTGPT